MKLWQLIRGLAWRKMAIAVVGGTVVLAGLVMLVTPGPGLVAIAAGLAILATEFEWAHRMLHRVRARIREQKERVQARLLERRQREDGRKDGN
jgi:uncharacterized protein (TIGR02611 family)